MQIEGELSGRAAPEDTSTMRTVGIITHYANINYGSALQSYALQRTLGSMAYHGENIRWGTGARSERSWIYRTARRWYRVLGSFVSATRRRETMFRLFINRHVHESRRVYSSLGSLTSLNDEYDAFICGSDQIWAPNQFNERYYLSFVHDHKRTIAYAPSIGLPSIPETLKTKMAGLIGRIEHLSVREQAGADIIKELTGRVATVTLDPTMLLDRDEWLKVATGTVPPGNYILCYFLGEHAQHRRAAESWCRKTGWPLVVLPFRDCDFEWGDQQIADAGPDRFLSLVDQARWILTDSFHGMVFSIIMNKPFNAFMRFSQDDPLCQNSRVEQLLDRFDLMHRIVSTDSMVSHVSDSLNYGAINGKVAAERRRSVQFLTNALREAVMHRAQ